METVGESRIKVKCVVLDFVMPKNCSIPGCTSRSDKEECSGVSFHKLPSDNTRRHQWLVSIKEPITVSSYTYICSLHFKNSKKSPDNDIPTIFPWSISVPVRNSPTRRPFTPPATKKHKSDEHLSEQVQSYATTLSKLQEEFTKVEKELQTVTAELQSIKTSYVERFGLRRFQGSDDDIRFYTGLPSYNILLCLYRYLEPLLPYLRYRPNNLEEPTRQLLNRQRLLQPVDELFLILVRLRLNLLEKYLGHRFSCSSYFYSITDMYSMVAIFIFTTISFIYLAIT